MTASSAPHEAQELPALAPNRDPLPAWMKAVAEILRCPVTNCDLRPAAPAEVARLNEQLATRGIAHHVGAESPASLEAAFVTVDGKRAYPVLSGIVLLTRNHAIDIEPDELQSSPLQALGFEKQQAQAFYDQIGWQRRSESEFTDSALHEDLRPVAREYLRRCNRRVACVLPAQGKYLLDVASGPVQFPEYIEYSRGFDYRLCVDLSFVALVEARRRLGAHGIYLLADITNLPLRDDAIDAVVSLHTVYHVPEREQANAVRELVRVTRPGGVVDVVYSAGDRCPLMKLPLLRFEALRPLRRRVAWYVRRIRDTLAGRSRSHEATGTSEPPRLYFHAHTLGWWRAQLQGLRWELRCWRCVHTQFLKLYVHRWLGGWVILAAVSWLEERCPRFFGRIGQYPMFVICKH